VPKGTRHKTDQRHTSQWKRPQSIGQAWSYVLAELIPLFSIVATSSRRICLRLVPWKEVRSETRLRAISRLL
jgi:hypothetical protein